MHLGSLEGEPMRSGDKAEQGFPAQSLREGKSDLDHRK